MGTRPPATTTRARPAMPRSSAVRSAAFQLVSTPSDPARLDDHLQRLSPGHWQAITTQLLRPQPVPGMLMSLDP
jgi:hypothetical protein